MLWAASSVFLHGDKYYPGIRRHWVTIVCVPNTHHLCVPYLSLSVLISKVGIGTPSHSVAVKIKWDVSFLYFLATIWPLTSNAFQPPSLLLSVIINSMYQFHWAIGDLDIWSNILGVHVRKFLNETHIWMGRPRKADCPPYVGGPHPISWRLK